MGFHSSLNRMLEPPPNCLCFWVGYKVSTYESSLLSIGNMLLLFVHLHSGLWNLKIISDRIDIYQNYIAGHFLLTNLLLDTMKKTSAKMKKEGRIVNVSSMAHKYTYREGIRFDKINDQAG